MKNTKETFMRKTIVVWFGAMLCCALWGSAFPSIKVGYRLFNIASSDVGSQILFAGCRFTLAGFLTIIMGSILNRKILIPQKHSWLKVIKLGLLQTVAQYIFFYIGLAHTTGAKAAIIDGLNVFIAVLLASIFFKQEKLTTVKMTGCFIGFVGVALVNLTKGGIDMNFQWNGEGFIFLSTVACAFASVYIKIYSEDENPVTLSGYQFTLGGIAMVICGIVMNGHLGMVTVKGCLMLLYLAMISAVAYSLWSILLKYNSVSKVAVFGFMTPVFGVILSVLLLSGESQQAFGMKSIIALTLVCSGIYSVNYEKNCKYVDNSTSL